VFADSFFLPPHDVPSTFPPRGARLFLLLLALGSLPPPPPPRGYLRLPLVGQRTRRPIDYDVSVPASSSAMADEKVRYSTAVGPLPVLSDPSTWAPAWDREGARMGVADPLAHATFRGIDSMRPVNPFARQIASMPHALLPSLDERARRSPWCGVAARWGTAVLKSASWTTPR